jgi:hypothetical protein
MAKGSQQFAFDIMVIGFGCAKLVRKSLDC